MLRSSIRNILFSMLFEIDRFCFEGIEIASSRLFFSPHELIANLSIDHVACLRKWTGRDIPISSYLSPYLFRTWSFAIDAVFRYKLHDVNKIVTCVCLTIHDEQFPENITTEQRLLPIAQILPILFSFVLYRYLLLATTIWAHSAD